MSWLTRIAGLLICGGGTFAVFMFYNPLEFSDPIIWGISGAFGIVGAFFGPKTVEALIQLL